MHNRLSRIFAGDSTEETLHRIVDLGQIEPLRFVQHQEWHELLIAGPTRSVVGTCGNDFPGLYYFDPRTRKEHVVMVEGEVDWRYATLGRRLMPVDTRRKGSKFHLVVGLFSERPLSRSVRLKTWEDQRVLPGGYEIEDRDIMPSQWEALKTLTTQSFRLLPLSPPSDIPDWDSIALKCLATLTKIRISDENGQYAFAETFRRNQSTYKSEPDQLPDRLYESSTELILHAGLASGLLCYAETNPPHEEEMRSFAQDLVPRLMHFYDQSSGFFQNTYPPRGNEWKRGVVDTWYAVYNLCNLCKVAQAVGLPPLRKRVSRSIERLIQFVRACNYQIPLFAKIGKSCSDYRGDGEIIGFALNPSVLGMYAALLTIAAEHHPQAADHYRQEAYTALSRLRRYPINEMFHQTVQLSWAALASHKLGLSDLRDDFTRCLLLNCYRQGEHTGLFQGCASMAYPSFKENVEAIEPWTYWLDNAPTELPLLEIMALILSKARAFIVQKKDSIGLPIEGLATCEQPGAGDIGIAIYAAGHVFDIARIYRWFHEHGRHYNASYLPKAA